MKTSIEDQKEKAKKNMSKLIDEHYEEFAKRSKQKKFNIDEMEKLMVEQQKKIRETLNESNSELAGSIKTDVKKNAPSAEDASGGSKKTKR